MLRENRRGGEPPTANRRPCSRVLTRRARRFEERPPFALPGPLEMLSFPLPGIRRASLNRANRQVGNEAAGGRGRSPSRSRFRFTKLAVGPCGGRSHRATKDTPAVLSRSWQRLLSLVSRGEGEASFPKERRREAQRSSARAGGPKLREGGPKLAMGLQRSPPFRTGTRPPSEPPAPRTVQRTGADSRKGTPTRAEDAYSTWR